MKRINIHSIGAWVGMILLLVLASNGYAQQPAGTTADKATRIVAPTTLTVQSGSNYVRIDSENLPAIITYTPSASFGTVPMALVMGDTLEAEVVFASCTTRWKWEIAESANVRIVEIKAHESALLDVQPYSCLTTSSDTTASSCSAFEWRGKIYEVTGDYADTLVNAAGCDSLRILHLTVSTSTESKDTIEVCDSYIWNEVTYTESGDYTFETTNAAGCDSTAMLHLTINKSTLSKDTMEVCNSYVWNEVTYTESGDYTFETTNAAGCDSTAMLHLTINKSSESKDTIEVCDSYLWNEVTYTESGDYIFNTTNTAGCDSTAMLHLTINKSTSSEDTQVACDSYIWNEETYTESGDYTFHTTNAAGCDSVATLHLTIGHPASSEWTIERCESYTSAQGNTYTSSGDYTEHTTTLLGCDSTIILHVTISENCMNYDTVYFCRGYNKEHEEQITDELIRRYRAYVYQSPSTWDYMEGVIVTGEIGRSLMNLRRAEENLYNHYVGELTPVETILWSVRDDASGAYKAITVETEPQWIEAGRLAVQIYFRCGEVYNTSMPMDVETVNEEQSAGRKVLVNGQMMIIRNGKKYNTIGLEIND